MRGMFLLLCSVLAAFGQNAQLTGRIADASGAVVPGAAVTVTNVDTGVERKTVSNEEGYYTVPFLQPGAYRMTVQHQGFKPVNREGVKLDVAQIGRIDFSLEVGQLTDAVTVTSTAPLLQSESSAVGQVIAQAQILDLPLNGRNFTQLATLTPGARASGASSAVVPSVNVQINGMRNSKTIFNIDGVSATDQRFDGVPILPPPDAIHEFKVQSNTMAAEYGQGGAVINVQLKPGTNQFHGHLYEFLRNDRLDARNFFALSRNKLKQNQFGFTAGGPVRRNRSFFFGNFEGLRTRRALTVNAVVPTEPMHRGDFSAVRAITDPVTRQPFPNSQIPASRLAPQATYFLKYFPFPNSPSGNYVRGAASVSDSDQVNARIDHVLGRSDTLQGSYSFRQVPTYTPGSFPENGGLEVNSRIQQLRLGEVHTFSPTMFNEFRGNFLRNRVFRTPQGLGTNHTMLAGIGGFELTSLEVPGFPGITISGYTGLNGNTYTPQRYWSNMFQAADNLTWIRGRHTLKAGVEMRRFRDGATNGAVGRGVFTFSGTYTANGFSDFLLGLPANGQRTFPRNQFSLRNRNEDFFFQDDWKVSPRLTINLGVRYELNDPPTAEHRTAASIDPVSRRIVVASDDQGNITLNAQQVTKFLYPRYKEFMTPASQVGLGASLQRWDTNNFEPRVGLAWEPVRGLVARLGYGIFHGLQQGNRVVSTLVANVPFIADETSIFNTTPTPTKTLVDLFAPMSLDGPGFLGPFTFFQLDPEIADPYFQQWNVALQKLVGGVLMVEGAYVGTKGTKVEFATPLNTPDPGPGAIQARRLWPLFSAGHMVHNVGNTIYHALQSKAELRAWHGLTLLAGYAWAKSIDDVIGDVQTSLVQDYRNTRAERALSQYDIRHRLTASAIYAVPTLAGQNPVARQVLGGWQISSILTFQAGIPFGPSIGTDPANTGRSMRPNRIGGGKLDNPTIYRWFDATAFSVPAAYTYGNCGRNILTGPGLRNWDFGLIKNFDLSRLREQLRVQFRAEFFNFTNTPAFDLPAGNIQTATVGRILSAGLPREVQFGLKLMF